MGRGPWVGLVHSVVVLLTGVSVVEFGLFRSMCKDYGGGKLGFETTMRCEIFNYRSVYLAE